MGKIRQGILGGFSGKVGTVVGASWNGIYYMRGLPQSYKKSRSSKQKMQQGYFRELIALSGQLSDDDLKAIYPKRPKGMTRRNLLVKQLAAFAVVSDDTKTVDLANLCTLGNAPTTDLPKVKVDVKRSGLQISWDETTYYRDQHPDEYPVIMLANITQQKLFLVPSTVVLKGSGKQSFEINIKPYGSERDDFSGFMFATGQNRPWVGFGTMIVTKRPPRPPKK